MDLERDVSFLALLLAWQARREARGQQRRSSAARRLTGQDLARMLRDRHPVEGGGDFRHVMPARSSSTCVTIKPSSSRPPRPTGPRSGATTTANSPTSARPSIAWRFPQRRTCRRHCPRRAADRVARAQRRTCAVSTAGPLRSRHGGEGFRNSRRCEWRTGLNLLARLGEAVRAACSRSPSPRNCGSCRRAPHYVALLLASGTTRGDDAAAAQRALIDAQIAQFPGGRHRLPHVYFLASLGHGEERVFAEDKARRETSAMSMFDARSCCCSMTVATFRPIRSHRSRH